MGMFAMRKPRGFNHSYIYVDERKEKLAKMEENGRMDWDNQLLPDEPVTYHAWHKQSATAGTALPDLPDAVTSVNAVIAELTTARLMVRDKSATVRSETGTNQIGRASCRERV